MKKIKIKEIKPGDSAQIIGNSVHVIRNGEQHWFYGDEAKIAIANMEREYEGYRPT